MMGTPNVFASFSFKVFSPCLLVKRAYVTVLSILSDFIKNMMRMSHIPVELLAVPRQVGLVESFGQ